MELQGLHDNWLGGETCPVGPWLGQGWVPLWVGEAAEKRLTLPGDPWVPCGGVIMLGPPGKVGRGPLQD